MISYLASRIFSLTFLLFSPGGTAGSADGTCLPCGITDGTNGTSWSPNNNILATCIDCSSSDFTCDPTTGQSTSCGTGSAGAPLGQCTTCADHSWSLDNNTLSVCTPCSSTVHVCDPTDGSPLSWFVNRFFLL